MAQAQVQAQAKQNLEPRPLEHVHPAMQTVQSQYPTQKTRMRTSFDPELELPKLQRWFNENQHPSRQQIQQYVKELNSLESRRGRKPLDVNNVVYWFKNARAAQKRAEVRNMSPGIPCHLSVNGYNSGSHSPPNGAGMILNTDRYNPLKSSTPGPYDRNPHMNMIPEEISMHSSIGEDESNADMGRNEIEQPMSPIGPLSLTKKRKRDDDENESPVRVSSPHNHQVRSFFNSYLTQSAVTICNVPNFSFDLQGGLLEPKIEPSDEPVNLHSPSDLSNNNKMKEHVSDPEDDVNEKEICNIGEKNLNESVSNDLSNQSRLEELARQQQLHRLCSPSSDHQENGQLIPRGPGGPENIDRLAGFPLVPNSMFSHSIMYMSHYIPGLGHGNIPNTPPPSSSGLNMSSLAASAADERRKRNRTFIDPVTEVPRLEQWFSLNTHPSHTMILKYTEELNRMQYRQKFPRLEPKNVQFWFKNRRAKCKRLKMSLYETQAPPGQYHQDRE